MKYCIINLYSNMIFIQVESVGSSAIKCKLNDVDISEWNKPSKMIQ